MHGREITAAERRAPARAQTIVAQGKRPQGRAALGKAIKKVQAPIGAAQSLCSQWLLHLCVDSLFFTHATHICMGRPHHCPCRPLLGSGSWWWSHPKRCALPPSPRIRQDKPGACLGLRLSRTPVRWRSAPSHCVLRRDMPRLRVIMLRRPSPEHELFSCPVALHQPGERRGLHN